MRILSIVMCALALCSTLACGRHVEEPDAGPPAPLGAPRAAQVRPSGPAPKFARPVPMGERREVGAVLARVKPTLGARLFGVAVADAGPTTMTDNFGRTITIAYDPVDDVWDYAAGTGFTLSYPDRSDAMALGTANGMTPGWWDGGVQ